MQRRNIQFPDPLIERADKIAADMDIKFTELARRAVEEFVERREKAAKSK